MLSVFTCRWRALSSVQFLWRVSVWTGLYQPAMHQPYTSPFAEMLTDRTEGGGISERGEDNPWFPQHVSCSLGTCQGQASDNIPGLADIHSDPVQGLTLCPSDASLWDLGIIRDCIYPEISWGRIRTLTVQQALGLHSWQFIFIEKVQKTAIEALLALWFQVAENVKAEVMLAGTIMKW